jgi:hypothetical protein
MTFRLSGDPGGDRTEQSERETTNILKREVDPRREYAAQISVNRIPPTHQSSLLPTEWRERAKNIARRSKDPRACLEHCKIRSYIILDGRMNRDEFPATGKKGSMVGGHQVCAPRGEEVEAVRCVQDEKIKGGLLRNFKLSTANSPLTVTAGRRSMDSIWKFQGKAESPVAGNCCFQSRMNTGAILDRRQWPGQR